METKDIIRAVLDLIDQAEQQETTFDEKPKNCGCGQDPCVTYGMQDTEQGEATASRFKQIFAILNNPSQGEYSNTPNEIVSDVDSVTTLAGGGMNGPKNPADIRVKDPRGFE